MEKIILRMCKGAATMRPKAHYGGGSEKPRDSKLSETNSQQFWGYFISTWIFVQIIHLQNKKLAPGARMGGGCALFPSDLMITKKKKKVLKS